MKRGSLFLRSAVLCLAVIVPVFGYYVLSYAPSQSKDTVYFSPNPEGPSLQARFEEAIRSAVSSIEIAQYASLRHPVTQQAILDALDRGVTVRMVLAFESPLEEAFTARAGKDSGIRYASKKKMHHKFLLIDREIPGPTQLLLTGSANISTGASTTHYEDVLALRSSKELIEEYSSEFERIWKYANDEPLTREEGELESYCDKPACVRFTSPLALFRKKRGVEEVNHVLQEVIHQIRRAKSSIYIASTFWTISELSEELLRKQNELPEIDIRLLTEGKGFIPEERLSAVLPEECRAPFYRNCNHYMAALLRLQSAEIPVRYLLNEFHFHYPESDLMHHSFILVDGKTLLTGSLNFSLTSIWSVAENLNVLRAREYGEILSAYASRFIELWTKGRDRSLGSVAIETQMSEGKMERMFSAVSVDYEEASQIYKVMESRCPGLGTNEVKYDGEWVFCQF